MLVKMFVLGRPGSGKSTAIAHIAVLADRRNYSTTHKKDYTLLRDMFEQDVKHEKFRPAEYGGFDVLKFTVLDDALELLEKQVRQLEKEVKERENEQQSAFSQKKEIVLIEFARDDYGKALRIFTPEFLKGSYFLFIEADLEICIKRIHYRRTSSALNEDRHSVSDFIMNSYYRSANYFPVQEQLSQNEDISIGIVENSGTLEEFKHRVGEFAQYMFDNEFTENQKQAEDSPNPEINEHQEQLASSATSNRNEDQKIQDSPATVAVPEGEMVPA